MRVSWEPASSFSTSHCLETGAACSQLYVFPEGPGAEGGADMKDQYREALECLARASNLLTEAQELELASAVYELSLDIATAASPDVTAVLAQKSAALLSAH